MIERTLPRYGPRPVNVLVCGSRDWPSFDVIAYALRQLPRGSTVLHGAARGADQMAGTLARGLGFYVWEFPADWRGQGRRAGILRNLAMLDTEPDLVLAFQRNGSRGTQHTIDEARKRGIPVEVFTA
jgi:hypothetical protein